MNPLKSAFHRAGGWYIQRICAAENQHQIFSHHNERSIEYRFALQVMAENRPKTVLDVGTGETAWPHLLRNCGFVVTAIDNVHDYWPKGMINRHWQVLDIDIAKPHTTSLRKQFEAITCISVLEHIKDYNQAVASMVSLLEDDGTLILTVPYNHNEFSPNVYKRPDSLYGQDAPYICRSYSKEQLIGWLAMGLTLQRRELWRLFSGPLWATGSRIPWEQFESFETPHQLACLAFKKSA
jgi:2-polyprenyl-3-methyl-5-hydroxy-6-metoxy-1,4-benzoquinol methylase